MTKPTEAQEREAFIADWMRRNKTERAPPRWMSGEYVYDRAESEWIGWWARASLQQPAQAEPSKSELTARINAALGAAFPNSPMQACIAQSAIAPFIAEVAQQDGAREPVAWSFRIHPSGALGFTDGKDENAGWLHHVDSYDIRPLYALPSPQSAADAQVMSAVANLIKVKGRHHTEQAYRLLVAAYDAAIKAEAEKGES